MRGKTDSTKIRLLAVERMILRGERITTQQIIRELDLNMTSRWDEKRFTRISSPLIASFR